MVLDKLRADFDLASKPARANGLDPVAPMRSLLSDNPGITTATEHFVSPIGIGCG
jgi:hypothetical protein